MATMSDRTALHVPDWSTVVQFLCRRGAYPENPREVELVETHISWVFLTPEHAYKLKKPVQFDFVDFSTLPRRREACENEVRLNRRLAPGVYLGVIPITIDERGRLQLDGSGRPVDYLVKMRRLPTERTLDALIRRGELTAGDVNKVAALLSDFYQRLSPLTVRADQYRSDIEHHVRANLAELSQAGHALPRGMVQRPHQGQLRLLKLAPELLNARVCDGRIVDGHGDLKPEHICLDTEPVVFDCIEFNDEFRRIDAIDELCFLAMECEHLGADAVGQKVLETYCRTSGDRPPRELMAFYKSYRACVRAKVLALRAEQLPPQQRDATLQQARRYLQLADRYAAPLAAPLVLVVGGLMGTGKSTLASALADALGLDVLGTDALRREMFGRSQQPAAFGEGIYRPAARRQVYFEMLDRAEGLLDERLSVVLDGTFLDSEPRTRLVELCRRRGATALFVRCWCPPEVARKRIAARGTRTASEARPELLDQQLATADDRAIGLPTVEVDTTEDLPLQVQAVLERLATIAPPVLSR